MKREKTVSFLPNIRNLFSGMHRSCFGRSELLCRQLYFKLNPSLKFLSSFNSPRNFFSSSRGETKMFLLIKPKIFFIFLNNSNRKRFASLHLGIFASQNKHHQSILTTLRDCPPPDSSFIIFQIHIFGSSILI